MRGAAGPPNAAAEGNACCWTTTCCPPSQPNDDLLAVDEALAKLAELDPRQAQLVELRFFGGLSVAEAAEVLGMSKRSAEREWTMVRAWLRRELSETDTP